MSTNLMGQVADLEHALVHTVNLVLRQKRANCANELRAALYQFAKEPTEEALRKLVAYNSRARYLLALAHDDRSVC